MGKKIKWIDYVKVIACILVVFGHFFQSMVKAEIISENEVYEWFNTTIYDFHVPLFFICSGFLYQKYSKVTNSMSWKKNIKKKALVLGIPYIAFSTLTWGLKTLFSNDVNTQIDTLGKTLFLKPTAPYWYLYCLLLIFFITPTFVSKKEAKRGLVIAFIGKIFISLWNEESIYAISTVLQNEIWFVLGMCIISFSIKLKGRKSVAGFCGIIFTVLSIVVSIFELKYPLLSFGLGLLACTAVILLVVEYEDLLINVKWFNVLAKYTMPIFLMHTLVAAPIRMMLLKFGIENAFVHIVIGLLVSFIGPIIAAIVMKKSKYLDFLLHPGRFITFR